MTRSGWKVRDLGLLAARLTFLLLCAFFAWRLFDDRWDELAPALAQMSYWVGVSAVLTIAGLLITSWVWTRVLACYGHPVPWPRAAAIFFTGQIGKYLPGSLWSIGVQARLVRSMGIPASRVTGTVLVLLVILVASGVSVGGVALAVSDSSLVPRSAAIGIAASGAIAFHPRILCWLSQVLSGLRGTARTTWTDSLRYVLAMAVMWGFYTAALLALLRDHSWSQTLLLVAAVTLSYAVGVLVVIAPAGLGAREAAFVVLMSPALGLSQATALALVARLVHTTADFLLALAGYRSLRSTASWLAPARNRR